VQLVFFRVRLLVLIGSERREFEENMAVVPPFFSGGCPSILFLYSFLFETFEILNDYFRYKHFLIPLTA
jgi:hypothetical protein